MFRLVIILVTLFGLLACVHNVRTSSARELFVQDDQNRHIVVFVHGFTGEYETTWGDFPKLILDHDNLNQYDVLIWGYPSRIFGLNPKIEQIGRHLKSELDLLDKYTDVILVGHSMGGLVIRSYIVSALQEGKGESLSKLKQVILFGVPNEGLDKANYIPKFVNRQIEDMRSFSEFIIKLRREWIQRVFRITENGRYNRNVPITTIAGIEDRFVPEESVRSFFPETEVTVGNHVSMVKPTSEEHMSFRLVKKTLISKNPAEKGTIKKLHNMLIKGRNSIAGTWHEETGGYRATGYIGPDRSGEWTTAKNLWLLARIYDQSLSNQMKAAIIWFLDKQNKNGGWGDLDWSIQSGSNPSCIESTAWGLVALQALRANSSIEFSSSLQESYTSALTWVFDNQRPDGGWATFGLQDNVGSRPYPTAMAILALLEAKRTMSPDALQKNIQLKAAIENGSRFLYRKKTTLGWAPHEDLEPQIATSGLALWVLTRASNEGYKVSGSENIKSYVSDFLRVLNSNKTLKPKYFIEPVDFTNPAVGFVSIAYYWEPWALGLSASNHHSELFHMTLREIDNRYFSRADRSYPWELTLNSYVMLNVLCESGFFLNKYDNSTPSEWCDISLQE